MTTISVILIVKNEAENLPSCLDSIKDWANEIIIVDSGSTDNTKEIALSYHAKFYEHTDWQGFGKQRQRAQQYATGDYLLWLDADEQVTPQLALSIQQAVKQNTPNTLYKIGRISRVFGREIRHSGWYPDWVVRLYPRNLTQYNDALVHESVIIPAHVNTILLNGELKHKTYKNLYQYLIKSANYANAWSEEKFKNNQHASLSKAITHATTSFLKMYVLKKGFLDGKQGFLLAVLSSISIFSKYAMLWDKSNHREG